MRSPKIQAQERVRLPRSLAIENSTILGIEVRNLDCFRHSSVHATVLLNVFRCEVYTRMQYDLEAEP